MNADARPSIAYIAGCIVNNSKYGSVYDFSQGTHVIFSGNATLANVSVYDHTKGCHITGNNGNLYHYGNGAHINIKFNGDSFSGYDYHTGSHYSGKVNGKSISLYDYGDGQHHNYSVG